MRRDATRRHTVDRKNLKWLTDFVSPASAVCIGRSVGLGPQDHVHDGKWAKYGVWYLIIVHRLSVTHADLFHLAFN